MSCVSSYFAKSKETDATSKAEALRLFMKARAAAALGYALAGDPSLHEAIYEAMAALQESGGLINSLKAALA